MNLAINQSKMPSHNLSKSKVMAYRQCPKRLWLQIFKPGCAEVSAQSMANISTGNQVGEIAIELYDKDSRRQVIQPFTDGWDDAVIKTKKWLNGQHPIFEGAFTIDGAIALVDVLKIDNSKFSNHWHMIEVKSSTSLKKIQIEDAAFQYFVVSLCGVKLSSVSLACIDNHWNYINEGDYNGLVVEYDITEQVRELQEDVKVWLFDAHSVAEQSKEPTVAMGNQCNSPYECEFKAYCEGQSDRAMFPVEWLPQRRGKLKEFIAKNKIKDMRDIPDERLNEQQTLVKQCTVNNAYFLDKESAKQAMQHCHYPLYFLDFETINFGVPRWLDTSPYQQIPFQFSIHKVSDKGIISHKEFLDFSGNDPSFLLANQLIKDCEEGGSILVYNQAFEKKRIQELAERFPHIADNLLAINQRIVDLLPICKKYYYHPKQEGSWSIKKVLPNMVPTLNYGELEGVQHGGEAMDAFIEAVHPETTEKRRQEIDCQLRAYCKLDTWAMVGIWEFFNSSQ